MFLGHVLLNEGGVLSVNKRVVLVGIKHFGDEDLFWTKLACLIPTGIVLKFLSLLLFCKFISHAICLRLFSLLSVSLFPADTNLLFPEAFY